MRTVNYLWKSQTNKDEGTSKFRNEKRDIRNHFKHPLMRLWEDCGKVPLSSSKPCCSPSSIWLWPVCPNQLNQGQRSCLPNYLITFLSNLNPNQEGYHCQTQKVSKANPLNPNNDLPCSVANLKKYGNFQIATIV